jgi:hypothetical protein
MGSRSKGNILKNPLLSVVWAGLGILFKAVWEK